MDSNAIDDAKLLDSMSKSRFSTNEEQKFDLRQPDFRNALSKITSKGGNVLSLVVYLHYTLTFIHYLCYNLTQHDTNVSDPFAEIHILSINWFA